MSAVTIDVGADGIAVATMDLPGRTMNVIRPFRSEELAEYCPVIPASRMQACMVSCVNPP